MFICFVLFCGVLCGLCVMLLLVLFVVIVCEVLLFVDYVDVDGLYVFIIVMGLEVQWVCNDYVVCCILFVCCVGIVIVLECGYVYFFIVVFVQIVVVVWLLVMLCIVVLLDIYGQYDLLVRLLYVYCVIDVVDCWLFGDVMLVVVGDVFDCGLQVMEVFWLFYSLQEQVCEVGGVVYFVFGNYEMMVFYDDLCYVNLKYLCSVVLFG